MSAQNAIFNDLPNLTQLNLKRLSDAVKSVNPKDVRSWEIEIVALQEHSLKTLTDEISAWAGKSPCLYYFEISQPIPSLELVTNAFNSAKVDPQRSGLAYARLNNSTGTCFYVGSSHSVATRLKQHLGYGHKGTYALQLKHWAPNNLKLNLVCALYANGTTPEVLQCLEDSLWENKQPLFGRRGRK